jgi:Pyruvate/2-oxoacid:ferredoxin oxidoreductase delta subunit
MLVVDATLCTRCLNCTLVCPVGADAIDPVSQKAKINVDICIECYACKNVCPVDAISEKD